MKVKRLHLSKDILLKMTDAERTFLLFSGHMQNEITSLHKVFSWCLTSVTSQPDTTIESLANGSQAMIYARLLAGKLYEGWELLGKAYFKSKLSLQLDEKLDPHTKECLSKLKAYFGTKANTIKGVRNSFSFHYSTKEFVMNWEEAADEGSFEFLIGGEIGNTFYQASELVANLALLNSIDPEDKSESHQRFFDEVQEITSLFTQFIQGAILIILEKHYGFDLSHSGSVEEISPARSFDEISIPFFYQFSAI